METCDDRVHLDFDIPSRGIIGLRSNLLTASAGEAIIAHRLKGFEPYKGDIEMRINGSLIAMETGDTFAYAINKLQDRGKFFIEPGETVYAGQVIGESTRPDDIVINVCKSKKLTNMRASGSDDKVNIAPPIKFSLEEALEYNDNYGHQEGDRCLIAIADCISEVAGAHGGFCARYGGDEFVVIYENISKEDAKEYVEELRRKVMELTLPHRFSKMLPIVTITQGMYCDVPKEENRVWDFLHVADEILYSVKTDNRGSCRVVDRAEFKLMSGYGTTIQGQA